MQRYTQLTQVKSEQIAAYEELHRAVWPEVLAMLHACTMRNSSIVRHDTLLVACCEYVGTDFAAAMARMAADPTTQQWWSHTAPMQEPFTERLPNSWWITIPEVVHAD